MLPAAPAPANSCIQPSARPPADEPPAPASPPVAKRKARNSARVKAARVVAVMRRLLSAQDFETFRTLLRQVCHDTLPVTEFRNRVVTLLVRYRGHGALLEYLDIFMPADTRFFS